MKKLIVLLMLAFPYIANAEGSKTNEVLSEFVKKAMVTMEKTGDFVIEQAPLVLQEFYKWHIAKNILGILFGIIIFLIIRYLPYIWLHKEKKYDDDIRFFNRYGDEDGIAFVSWIVFIIGSITTLFLIPYCVYTLIFILVAPKFYLIEFFIK